MACLVNGRIVEFGADNLYVFWAATPYKLLRAHDDARASFVTLPFSYLFHWSLPPALVRYLLEGHVVGRFARGARDARLFERWERDLATDSPQNSDATLLEIHARLVRFALQSLPDTQDALPPTLATSAVEQLATHVAAHYFERRSAREMSAELHARPGYAMSLFRKSLGMSLGRYLAHHRVAHAVRLLATTDLPVSEIAQVSGFASLRRMTNAFRGALRCSPAEFRRRHRLAPITVNVP